MEMIEESSLMKAKITDYMLKNKDPNENSETRHDAELRDLDENESIEFETAPKSDTLPEIFQTEHLTFVERWNVLKWDILPDSKPMEVEQSFYYYVKEHVQTSGWQAVWRSRQLMCNVLVEVKELQSEFQRAKVELVMPFCCESLDMDTVSELRANEVLKANMDRVSLLELIPVFDESGDLDSTAVALEHLRFFYDYIWRESDESDSGDYIYADRHPESRMKLYYDVKDKSVSASVAERYIETITEYQQKHWQLKFKRAQYEPNSDKEEEDGPEIPEDDMAEMTDLCEDLESLMKTLEKLEHPVMRAIVMRGSKKSGKMSSEQRHSRPNQEVISHLVAEKLTIAMIKILDIDDNTIICQHRSPVSALDSCYNGDTIFLFPGRYSGEGFYNLTQSVNIKGVGANPSDVVIVCQEKVGIFVDCTAYQLSISNMTFESDAQLSPSFAALDVRTGTTTVTNCVFNSLYRNIVVSKEGTLNMDQCEILGFNTPGIAVSDGGTLTLTNSHIHHCGGSLGNDDNHASHHSGLWIEAADGAEGLDQTTVSLINNKIEDNDGPGIWIDIYTLSPKATSKPTNVGTDKEVACLLPPYVKWQANDNVFSNNKDSAICVHYVTLSTNTVQVMETT